MVFFGGQEVDASGLRCSSTRYNCIRGTSFELDNSCILQLRSSYGGNHIFLLVLIINEHRPNSSCNVNGHVEGSPLSIESYFQSTEVEDCLNFLQPAIAEDKLI